MNHILDDAKNIKQFYIKVAEYIGNNAANISESDSLCYRASVNYISSFYFDRATDVSGFNTLSDPSDDEIEEMEITSSLVNRFNEIFKTIKIKDGCIDEYFELFYAITTEYYTSDYYYSMHD